MIPFFAAVALAADDGEAPDRPDAPTVELHGDVKAFVTASVPYDHVLMPPGGTVNGIADGRLKLEAAYRRWSFEAHHAISLIEGATSGLSVNTGVARTAPEAVDLTWQVDDGELVARGRTDRLWVRGAFGPVTATVGRQPISFGTGLMFTPMDLVAPFQAATVDTEYKPGVDAVRVDAYAGTSGQVSVVGAYAGSWDLEGTVFAAYGQGTVGVTDLGLFAGEIHGEHVVGASVATGVGPVGLHADATVTVPQDEAPFVRAVAGVFAMITPTTSVTSELYVQTFGAADPAEYLVVAQDPRFARGEVWQMGRYYAGLSVGQELTPLVSVNAAVIANLADPSALVAPGVAWNVSENAAVSAGAWFGLGQRPADVNPAQPTNPAEVDAYLRDLGIRSEFGIYPASLFLRMATYF